MKASELVKEIEKAVAEHGDLEIEIDGDGGYVPISEVSTNLSFKPDILLVIYGNGNVH